MRLNRQLTLCLAAALYAVCVLSIILPDETDSISTTGSSTAVSPTASSPLEPLPDKAPPPAPLSQSLVGSTRAIPAAATTVVIETDIAENIAELDVDLLDQSHSSKEVQDSDGGQRQNYASKDSGATVLDHAPGTKGSVNLLVPDKDRYMLIPCASEKKWVVVSLSEDIHADAIAIANYEKFSSPTRDFLVLGSINYPSDTWVVLGNFTASHRNGEQLFEFHESHHVRYIKLRMMSHYGSEYYCTMSQIRYIRSRLVPRTKFVMPLLDLSRALVQVLETNVSQLEKVLHDLHRNHAISLQAFEQLWDVIRTMKAGIMAALLLSAILLVFSICRWVFRCLTACHRRAARREWFRRLDVADTSEITSPHDEDTVDDDFNPLTQTMHHRVDRTIRFGSSFDDGAIQRNTMYRRYVVSSALG
ncbi:hypothetical protein DYB32_010249 [Aphanomyces invadans]|uniref:SUN domain-containing protein n=1 Tax=Aphanomyces invadans TaxID=157072 RepID=A0A418AGB7_9STRA|nr:hypothetical protein DYB32_010249 [Aphanomyces invadans]